MVRLGVWIAVFLPGIKAQTDPATPWAVLATRSAAVSDLYLGPSIVSASGDLYVANSLADATKPTKTFGDTSNGWTDASRTGASGSFAVRLGGLYSVTEVALDSADNLLIAGTARTTGVPVTPGAYRATPPGDHAAFVCKLSAADGTPIFCTYLDSADMDLRAIAVDSSANVYVLAHRSTASLAATPGALSVGNRQIVLLKLDATGSSMKFIAEFGGSASDGPNAMSVDPSGNIYIAGSTTSRDFPGTAGGAVPNLPAGNPGAPGNSSFVAKVDPSGSRILWASYGRPYDTVSALAVDGSGEVYLAGLLNGSSVRKFSADGSAILWETSAATSASSIGIDSLSVVTLIGETQSINFPVHHSTAMCPVQVGHTQVNYSGGSVLIRLSPTGDLLQSTFLGTLGILRALALSPTSATGYVVSQGYELPTSLAVAQVGPDVGGKFATALGCVGNAATPLNSNTPPALAPGEIVSIFGEGLGPATSSLWTLTSDNRISSSLAGVQVTFDGIPAPLLYVQSSQINAVTPWSLTGKSTTHLCVNYAGQSNCANASVVPAVPAFFTALANYGGAINQDGTLNTPQNPAPAGTVISLFLTGLGPLSPGQFDGAMTPWPAPSLAYTVQVWFPNPDFHVNLPYTGEVLYAGPAPLAVGGLYQVNVRIPNTQSNPISGQPAVPSLWVTVTLPDGSLVYAPSVMIATR